MRFIHTLYISKSTSPYLHSFGWALPVYHLMSWTLSSLQLNKIYGNIELYANSSAASLLIDTLKLPYSKIHITHDRLKLVHHSLWALPKIHTYSLQEEPFLHIDGDVFIFNEFDTTLLERELIAQNIEFATDYYTSTQKELLRHLTYIPKSVKAEFNLPEPIKAVNAGIIGGNNVIFLRSMQKKLLTMFIIMPAIFQL